MSCARRRTRPGGGPRPALAFLIVTVRGALALGLSRSFWRGAAPAARPLRAWGDAARKDFTFILGRRTATPLREPPRARAPAGDAMATPVLGGRRSEERGGEKGQVSGEKEENIGILCASSPGGTDVQAGHRGCQ